MVDLCILYKKKAIVPHSPVISESEVIITLLYKPCSSCYTQQHESRELFNKHLCNQSSPYENTDDFHYAQRKPSCAVNKDEWDIKEDTGKPMKNTL